MPYHKTDPLYRCGPAQRLGAPSYPDEWYRYIQPNAQARAEVLLRNNLDSKQLRDWNRTKTFLTTSASGRLWRIARGYSHNLWLIKGDPVIAYGGGHVRPGDTMCVHVSIGEWIPLEDNALAQKLWLESPDLEGHLYRLAIKGNNLPLRDGRL